MKNISLVLNGILTIAVIVLFYLHFSEKNSEESEEIAVAEEVENAEPVVEEITSSIGYINVDSLQKNYKFYADLINKLKARESKYEKELAQKSSAFEKKVMEFQQKAPTMTQFEGQTRQKELGEEEQRLYKLRDDFALKFQNEEARLNEEFQKDVKDYIKEFNKEKNYNIIIGASQLGNVVLYYNEGINVSNAIISGLNEQYKKKNEKEVKK
jgi:outer membrane protein